MFLLRCHKLKEGIWETSVHCACLTDNNIVCGKSGGKPHNIIILLYKWKSKRNLQFTHCFNKKSVITTSSRDFNFLRNVILWLCGLHKGNNVFYTNHINQVSLETRPLTTVSKGSNILLSTWIWTNGTCQIQLCFGWCACISHGHMLTIKQYAWVNSKIMFRIIIIITDFT